MKNVNKHKSTLCRTLAPEEIQPGQHVALLHIVRQYLPYASIFDDPCLSPKSVSPKQVRWLPRGDNPPLRVRAVCLPFVLVEQPSGDVRTLDVRRCQLARLKATYALQAWTCAVEQARRDEAKAKKDE